jgi:hypothetical protein
MTTRSPRALARLSALASALALLAAPPARAGDDVHSQTTPPAPRGDPRGGLLLLSFLVPLPLPLALVAPPAASRPPVSSGPALAAGGRAPAPAPPAARAVRQARR